MRPEILNPLFAETQSLTGVGKVLSKPLERLRLIRVKDLLFHKPSYWMHRKHIKELDEQDVGLNIVIEITPVDYRSGGPRSPFRVQATDELGNYISLTFFGRNSGWPKKLLPLNEPKLISGKLERYGDELQMLHPDVLEPSELNEIRLVEPIYPLSDGLGNKRMGRVVEQSLAFAPELPEWTEPSLMASKQGKHWQTSFHGANHGERKAPTDRLAYA